MVEVCSISQEQQQQQKQQQQHQNVAPSAAPPPPRRPRVREVSSRFMSPVVSSSSSGDLHLPSSKCPLPKHTTVSTSTELHPKHHHHPQFQRSKSAHKREEEQEPLSCADENRLDTARSLDTPLGSHSKLVHTMQRKSQRAVKLFKENNGGLEQQHSDALHHLRTSINGKLQTRTARSRPDTPVVDRMNPRSVISTPHSQRLANISVADAASTAAAKLVQSSGMSTAQTSAGSQVTSSSSQVSTSMSVNSSNSDYDDRCSENHTENSTSSESFETEICSSPKIPVQKSKMRSFPDVRSSMPEVDMVPTMSSRFLAQRDRGGGNGIGDSSKVASSPFYRYMNTPLSSCEQPFSSPTKSVYRSSSFLPKPHPSSIKSSNVNMTPHPSNTMSGVEARKGKKASSHQEDVHALRMLHNRYLQWRYSNAKAEVTMNAQTIAAESSLYGIVTKISEMRYSVKLKRSELELLKRTGVLSNILDAQMPHLDEWSAMEGDYSTSLLGVTKALRDASLRLPICGNVRVDMREVDGALNSASNLMEILSLHVESFLPKAEEVDSLVSELAAVVSRERALIEECGDLLSKTQMLQVEECSLRGQLMQLKRISLDQTKEEEQ